MILAQIGDAVCATLWPRAVTSWGAERGGYVAGMRVVWEARLADERATPWKTQTSAFQDGKDVTSTTVMLVNAGAFLLQNLSRFPQTFFQAFHVRVRFGRDDAVLLREFVERDFREEHLTSAERRQETTRALEAGVGFYQEPFQVFVTDARRHGGHTGRATGGAFTVVDDRFAEAECFGKDLKYLFGEAHTPFNGVVQIQRTFPIAVVEFGQRDIGLNVLGVSQA